MAHLTGLPRHCVVQLSCQCALFDGRAFLGIVVIQAGCTLYKRGFRVFAALPAIVCLLNGCGQKSQNVPVMCFSFVPVEGFLSNIRLGRR